MVINVWLNSVCANLLFDFYENTSKYVCGPLVGKPLKFEINLNKNMKMKNC